jgi:hypothetical protein
MAKLVLWLHLKRKLIDHTFMLAPTEFNTLAKQAIQADLCIVGLMVG